MNWKSTLAVWGSLLLWAWLAACGPASDQAGQLPPLIQTQMDETGGAYVALTLPEALNPALNSQLEDAGIRLFDPVGEQRFQAYVPETAVSALAALRAANVIIDVTPIEPAGKIKGDFADSQATYAVVVQFYQAPAESETAVLSGHMMVERTAVGVMNFVEGQATGEQIQQMAELPFVKLIQAAVESTGGN